MLVDLVPPAPSSEVATDGASDTDDPVITAVTLDSSNT